MALEVDVQAPVPQSLFGGIWQRLSVPAFFSFSHVRSGLATPLQRPCECCILCLLLRLSHAVLSARIQHGRLEQSYGKYVAAVTLPVGNVYAPLLLTNRFVRMRRTSVYRTSDVRDSQSIVRCSIRSPRQASGAVSFHTDVFSVDPFRSARPSFSRQQISNAASNDVRNTVLANSRAASPSTLSPLTEVVAFLHEFLLHRLISVQAPAPRTISDVQAYPSSAVRQVVGPQTWTLARLC